MTRYTEKKNIVHVFECDSSLSSELLSAIESIKSSTSTKQYIVEPGIDCIMITVYSRSMKKLQRIVVNTGEYLKIDGKGVLSIINESMLNNLIKVE